MTDERFSANPAVAMFSDSGTARAPFAVIRPAVPIVRTSGTASTPRLSANPAVSIVSVSGNVTLPIFLPIPAVPIVNTNGTASTPRFNANPAVPIVSVSGTAAAPFAVIFPAVAMFTSSGRVTDPYCVIGPEAAVWPARRTPARFNCHDCGCRLGVHWTPLMPSTPSGDPHECSSSGTVAVPRSHG